MGKRKGSRRTLCWRRTTRPRLRRNRTIRRRRRGGGPSGTCKTCNRPFATGWAQVALGTHCVRGACPHSKSKKKKAKFHTKTTDTCSRPTSQCVYDFPLAPPPFVRQTAQDYGSGFPSRSDASRSWHTQIQSGGELAYIHK